MLKAAQSCCPHSRSVKETREGGHHHSEDVQSCRRNSPEHKFQDMVHRQEGGSSGEATSVQHTLARPRQQALVACELPCSATQRAGGPTAGVVGGRSICR